MNAALQNLEIKVENGGTTPQGRLTSSEWNILVAAVKALDADSDNADVSDVLRIVENAGYATQDWVNGKLTDYATQSSLNALSLGILGKADQTYVENTFVKLAAAQSIAARHNFVDGLKVGDLSIYKSQDKTIYIDGNLVVSGSFTMFGKDSTTFPTIWANIPFDDTMRWDGSRWSVVASTVGGGGVADSVAWSNITGKPEALTTFLSTGNASTATKLQNAVSLWGRSFDGSADLTGSLTVTTGEGYRINYNGYDLRFIVSGSSANRGIWDNTLNSWMMYRDDTENVRFPKGDVGIGDVSPSYKLHVQGTLGVSGVATFAGKINLTSSNSYISIGDKEILGSYLTNYYLFDSAVTNGYTSFIVGKNIKFQTGTATKTTVLTIDEKGDITSSGVLKLPAVDSGFTNPRITFGDNVIRIGATTAGLLGVYASGDIRINPNSATSANSTMGLWLKASGFNGINISNPTQALHVNGKGIFADATNPWVAMQRDGVNWYVQVTSGGMRIGRSSALGILVDASGNLLIPGVLSMNQSSDKRLKKNIRKVNASKVLMSLGEVYQYEYIDAEVEKNHIYEGTHFGLIYQNVKGTTLKSMCHEREDGYGALNYLDTNFISLIAGAIRENISEVEKLKRKIRILENKVEQLERVA